MKTFNSEEEKTEKNVKRQVLRQSGGFTFDRDKHTHSVFIFCNVYLRDS